MKINRESIKMVNQLYGRKNLERQLELRLGFIVDEVHFINRPNYKKQSIYNCYSKASKNKIEIYKNLVQEAVDFGSHSFGIISFNVYKFDFAYDFTLSLYDTDCRKRRYIATIKVSPFQKAENGYAMQKRVLWLEESDIL